MLPSRVRRAFPISRRLPSAGRVCHKRKSNAISALPRRGANPPTSRTYARNSHPSLLPGRSSSWCSRFSSEQEMPRACSLAIRYPPRRPPGVLTAQVQALSGWPCGERDRCRRPGPKNVKCGCGHALGGSLRWKGCGIRFGQQSYRFASDGFRSLRLRDRQILPNEFRSLRLRC